jgi:hypothetical protein
VPDQDQPSAAAPAQTPSPLVRASDADRENAAEQLKDHAAAGRLTPAELEQRIHAALTARTTAELTKLLADLPEPANLTDQRKPRRWFVSLFGSSSRRPRFHVARRVICIAVMASPGIDLCESELTGDEIVMRAFALCGWPDIYLPDSVGLELSGFALFGGDAERGSTRAPAAGAPVIKIRAYGVCGGCTVWRLPPELQGLPHREARRAARALPGAHSS